MTDANVGEMHGKPGPADLVEIFYAPSAVFNRRRAGEFGLPYLGLIGLGVILFVATHSLMQPVIDAEIARGMARSTAKMTPEQAAAGASMGKTIGSVGLVAFWFIAPFVVALLAWISGKLSGVREIGRVAIMVSTFALFPRLIGSVVGAVLAAVMPEGSLTSAASISISPARFIDVAAHPGLAGLLGRFDLFILWGIVLIAIGVRVAGDTTKGKAWSTAIGVWAIGTLPAIYGLIKYG